MKVLTRPTVCKCGGKFLFDRQRNAVYYYHCEKCGLPVEYSADY